MNDPIHLLYAEDNPQDADLTQQHFERAATDFNLEIVDSGARCLERLAAEPFDLLLLDKRLPDMDGLDLLARLRTEGQRLPVVMVTGIGDDETVARALRAGAADYVPKSTDYLSTLPDILRGVIARSRQRRPLDEEGAARVQRILYVESNPMDVELTREHFATHAPHLELHAVSAALDALALLVPGPQSQSQSQSRRSFDLVLTDLRLPGMGALELIREAQHRGIHLPFIVITGRGDEATAVAILRLGAYDYILKRENYLTQLPFAIDHAIERFHLDQTTERLHSELESLNASLEQKVAARTTELQHEIETRKALQAQSQQQLEHLAQAEIESRRLLELAERSRRASLGVLEDQQQAQQALRAKSDELDRYFVNSLDLLCIADMQGHFRRINPEWERTLGYPLAELEGRNFLDFVHPDDLPATLAAMAQLSSQERILNFVNRYRHQNGSYLWIEWRSYAEGSRIYAVARDITESKNAQTLLASQKRTLEMVASGATLAVTLDALVHAIEELVPEMLGSILLLDEDGVHVRHGAAPSLPQSYSQAIDGQPIGEGAGSCGTAAYRREQVIVTDIATDPLWQNYREVALQHGLRACWSTPIFDQQQRVLGTFACYFRTPRGPSAEHLHLITLVTHIAAIAIAKAREEAALRASELKFRTIIEASPVAMAVNDQQQNITFLNRKFIETFGYTLADIPTLAAWWPRAYPDPAYRQRVAQEWQAAVEKAQRDGTEFEPMEHKVTSQDGSVHVIRFSLAPMDTSSLVIFYDLTEHKQAEQALHTSEQQLRFVTDHMPVLIAHCDHEQRYKFVNRPYAQMFGLKPTDMIGKQVQDMLGEAAYGQARPYMEAALAGQSVEYDITLPVTERGVRTVHANYVPERDASGRVVGFVAAVLDISERKRAENNLRESEERLRLSTELANVAVWEYDFTINQMSRSSNHDRLYGLEWQTKWDLDTFQNATHPDDRQFSNEVIQKSVATGGPDKYQMDFRVVYPDQSIHWLSVVGEVLQRNAQGQGVIVRGCLFDITDRMRAQEENRRLHQNLQRHAAELEQRVAERTAELVIAKERAEAADRVKSSFLATMSHELRTPLNSVIGFTGVLLQKIPGPLNAEQEKQLNFVLTAGRHLLALISDVLDISKVEAGELHLAREPFDFSALMARVGAAFAQQAGQRGLAFKLVPCRDRVMLTGDTRRVEQVLNNLISNALKFTDHGSITLSCAREDHCLVISVADTGVGIQPEDMEKLFRPFSQIDTGMDGLREGTGLGLAITKHLVEAMGGEVRATSTWGQGSCFGFTLSTGESA